MASAAGLDLSRRGRRTIFRLTRPCDMAAAFAPASVTRLWDFAPFFTLQPVDAARASPLSG